MYRVSFWIHSIGAAAVILGINSTMSPTEVTNALLSKSISGAVSDPETGSPNLLLYVGEGNGGGFVPGPVDPVDPVDPADPSKYPFLSSQL